MTTLIQSLGTVNKQSSIRELIKTHDDGRQFTVVNVKADGTLREYHAMTNVQAGLKGGESTTAHKPNLLTIFDTVANEYRAVNLDTVLFVKIAGKEFIFLDDATATKIKDTSVSRALNTAAVVADTALRVVRKSIGL